jgi:hypothetical protein
VYRVLKPGARLGIYDWMMTDKYDPKNAEHVLIKKGIELGNGIADLPEGSKVVIDALREAGFEVEEDTGLVHRRSCQSKSQTPAVALGTAMHRCRTDQRVPGAHHAAGFAAVRDNCVAIQHMNGKRHHQLCQWAETPGPGRSVGMEPRLGRSDG